MKTTDSYQFVETPAVLRDATCDTHKSQFVPIGVAARKMGVHPDTPRRWGREGMIGPPERTDGEWRRYDLAELRDIAPHKFL
ncbi:MAG: MerR family transcriptional regulator [Ferrimicrobium sp.]